MNKKEFLEAAIMNPILMEKGTVFVYNNNYRESIIQFEDCDEPISIEEMSEHGLVTLGGSEYHPLLLGGVVSPTTIYPDYGQGTTANAYRRDMKK